MPERNAGGARGLPEHMDALDARQHLLVLEEERMFARRRGLLDDPAYRAELEHEISTCRRLYVSAAVTEISTLHGVLFGRHQG